MSNATLKVLLAAPKLPRDIEILSTVASLSFCPVKGAERRAREDHIASLISSALGK
jgi:hypothetical protein